MKSKLFTHLLVIAIGIILCLIYLNPVLQGKVLQQGDVIQATAMQHEVLEHKEKTGTYALWTNNLFSGMPTYLMGVDYKSPIIGKLLVPIETFFKSPICFLIYYFLGFYLLMIVLGASPWLSLIGAIMFTFSSYNFIILEAGHNTKARCIGFLPFILAGTILLFQRKYLLGAMLVSLFLFFQIKSNHPQITYYMLLMLGLYFVYQLVQTIQDKSWKNYILSAVFFGISATLAVTANFAQLWVTYEYTKDTMRGGSELAAPAQAANADGAVAGKNIKGLDKAYAFNWSYGKFESFTLLIPNLYGGASYGTLNDKSKVYDALVNQGVPTEQAANFAYQMPTYWGPKVAENSSATTSGPNYLGAVICFLFLLGIFVIKDNWRWWIFGSSILALFMAWGKFFMGFNTLLFDYLPMYNKFRTPEMALTLLEVTFPMFGLIALKRILDGEVKKEDVIKYLKYSVIGMGAFLLIMGVMPSLFLSFNGGDMDEALRKNLAGNGEGFASKVIEALRADRESLARTDAFRSLVFILLTAGAIWLFVTDKIKKNVVLAIIGLATLVDLWTLDKRFLNDDKFHEAEEMNNNYTESAADQQILQDKSVSYRVFNFATDPFNDALTSYHHKNIGGYNPAKLARYQDIIDSCLRKNNRNVINMLNTKYFIGKTQDGKEVAQLNPEAMGNAWTVDTIVYVNSPREEIMALNKINPATTAVIDASKFKDAVSKTTFDKDSTAKVKLMRNDLDELEYAYSAAKPQVLVMSEVFYADKAGKGWQAYVDDKPVDHFRVNYILRGMELPAGTHKIIFKFEPKAFLRGQQISMISSILLTLLLVAAIAMWIKDNRSKYTSAAIDEPAAKKKK